MVCLKVRLVHIRLSTCDRSSVTVLAVRSTGLTSESGWAGRGGGDPKALLVPHREDRMCRLSGDVFLKLRRHALRPARARVMEVVKRKFCEVKDD